MSSQVVPDNLKLFSDTFLSQRFKFDKIRYTYSYLFIEEEGKSEINLPVDPDSYVRQVTL